MPNLVAVPTEIEQRWLMKPEAVEGLKRQAVKSLDIIQGYLDEKVVDLGRITEQVIKREIVNSTIKISVGRNALLSLKIPNEEAAQLQENNSELLKNMRFRFQQDTRTKEVSCFLTIKGSKQKGVASEYEYSIDNARALNILNKYCAGKVLQKTRYVIPDGEHQIELDYFPDKKLYIAEREVKNSNEMLTDLPEWASQDITEGHGQYSNYNMAEPASLDLKQKIRALNGHNSAHAI